MKQIKLLVAVLLAVSITACSTAPKITRKKENSSPFEIDLDGELDDLMELVK